MTKKWKWFTVGMIIVVSAAAVVTAAYCTILNLNKKHEDYFPNNENNNINKIDLSNNLDANYAISDDLKVVDNSLVLDIKPSSNDSSEQYNYLNFVAPQIESNDYLSSIESISITVPEHTVVNFAAESFNSFINLKNISIECTNPNEAYLYNIESSAFNKNIVSFNSYVTYVPFYESYRTNLLNPISFNNYTNLNSFFGYVNLKNDDEFFKVIGTNEYIDSEGNKIQYDLYNLCSSDWTIPQNYFSNTNISVIPSLFWLKSNNSFTNTPLHDFEIDMNNSTSNITDLNSFLLSFYFIALPLIALIGIGIALIVLIVFLYILFGWMLPHTQNII